MGGKLPACGRACNVRQVFSAAWTKNARQLREKPIQVNFSGDGLC
jgi:hypothetical protein